VRKRSPQCSTVASDSMTPHIRHRRSAGVGRGAHRVGSELDVSPGRSPRRHSIDQLTELAKGRTVVMAHEGDQSADATATKLRQAVGVERMRPQQSRDWNDELREQIERQRIEAER